jgi:hypothetical protein
MKLDKQQKARRSLTIKERVFLLSSLPARFFLPVVEIKEQPGFL